jgi:hypothetical protein
MTGSGAASSAIYCYYKNANHEGITVSYIISAVFDGEMEEICFY